MERISLRKRRDPLEVRMRILHELIKRGGKASKWDLLWSSRVAYSGAWAFNDLVDHNLLTTSMEQSLHRQGNVAFATITDKGRKAWEHYSALRADLE